MCKFGQKRSSQTGFGKGDDRNLISETGELGWRLFRKLPVGSQNDELLQIALKKNGLAHKARLLVGDSVDGEAKADFYDLVFVDGDHSYKGVVNDYDHWRKAVKPGGYLAFHNAAAGGPHILTVPGPFRLVQEIAARDAEYYRREPDVGSLALFIRTQRPFS